jgi:hypothetical protein
LIGESPSLSIRRGPEEGKSSELEEELYISEENGRLSSSVVVPQIRPFKTF